MTQTILKQNTTTDLTFKELQQVRECFPKGFKPYSKFVYEGREVILVKEKRD